MPLPSQHTCVVRFIHIMTAKMAAPKTQNVGVGMTVYSLPCLHTAVFLPSFRCFLHSHIYVSPFLEMFHVLVHDCSAHVLLSVLLLQCARNTVWIKSAHPDLQLLQKI